jgi:hypothetical protein
MLPDAGIPGDAPKGLAAAESAPEYGAFPDPERGDERRTQVLVRTRPDPAEQTRESELFKIAQARIKGFEGDPCPSCGSFTLVRNGTCMKCQTCGGTTGCS